ncbi:MAG: RDD family protein [Methanoregula sp.]|nr:RDD family protein [Methanoregula sp.]
MAPEPICISPVPERTLHLAKWSARFWAWLVDIIIIILFWNIVIGIFDHIWKLPLLWEYRYWELSAIGLETLLIFIYWTVMEGFRGQSIGKMVMNLKVVNRDGSKISYRTAAIESLPKAFLNFPFIIIIILDCLIGWLAMPNTKLRVFNRISNTIVIKTNYKEPDGVMYVKEKE